MLLTGRMATHAISEICDPFPSVLARDLPLIVAGVACIAGRVPSGMAGGTIPVGAAMIQRKGVPERRAAPGAGRVALATLSREVIGRRLARVTAPAVDKTTVVKLHRRPIRRAGMAIAALARIVVLRSIAAVAALAVYEPRMIEADLSPVCRAQMAAAALAGIVILRGTIAVTALAVDKP